VRCLCSLAEIPWWQRYSRHKKLCLYLMPQWYHEAYIASHLERTPIKKMGFFSNWSTCRRIREFLALRSRRRPKPASLLRPSSLVHCQCQRAPTSRLTVRAYDEGIPELKKLRDFDRARLPPSFRSLGSHPRSLMSIRALVVALLPGTGRGRPPSSLPSSYRISRGPSPLRQAPGPTCGLPRSTQVVTTR